MKLRTALMVGLVALVSACSFGDIKGSGNVISESRNVSGFTGVELDGDADLDIEQMGTESLTITADDNILPLLKSEVRDSRLVLDMRNGISSDAEKRVRYKLSVKNLHEIRMYGDGHIDAKGIMSDRLKVSITGDGDVRTAGIAENQEIDIIGDGNYRAPELNSKVARVGITGDANVTLAVSEKLDAKIIGDGNVDYTGNPTISQNIVGDGAVRKK